MIRVIVFVVGGLLFGAAVLGIGYAVAGESALVQGGSAFGLAFVPAAATLAWVLYSYRAAPEMQLAASLGGNGIRMGLAAGGGWILTQAFPDAFDTTFWFWLALFYLTLLAFETTLVVWRKPKVNS